MMVSDGDIATNVVATAAVASPLWLPWLQTASATFAMLVPILGGVWLIVQITRALIQGWFNYRAWRSKQAK